jgi:hypothetical protein
MRLALALTVSMATVDLAGAQQPAPSQSAWAGWARCRIDVTGPGYTDQQTHTWTMTGGAPTVEGAFRIFPATWSVVGGGSLQKTVGTQTLVAQWSTNSPSVSAPIAVFVRASDQRMFIQARHAQARAAGAVQGYQQQIIDGKMQKPGPISAEAFEWAFPRAEVSRPTPTSSLVANGSSAPVVNGKVGLMEPDGSHATASCTWQFSQGAAPAPPPAVAAPAVPTPAATGVATRSPPTPPAGVSGGGTPGGTTSGSPSTCIGPPQNLTASVDASKTVTFQWTAPAVGVPTSYIIEASSSPGGPPDLANFNQGSAQTSLTVPSVPAGSYHVRVRALSGCVGAVSAPSNEVLLVVP